MSHSRPLSRPAASLVAGLVVALTLACVRHAFAAVTVAFEAASHAQVKYDFSSGAGNQIFTLPVKDTPIQITIANSGSYFSVCSVVIANHSVSNGSWTTWTGMDPNGRGVFGNINVAAGGSGTQIIPIVFGNVSLQIHDYSNGKVHLRVAGNTGNHGTVSMIW